MDQISEWIESAQDGDTKQAYGGTLVCRNAYRGFFEWTGKDSCGYDIDVQMIRAEDGGWNFGRWDDCHLQYSAPGYNGGRDIRRRPFERGAVAHIGNLIGITKKNAEEFYSA